MRRWPSARVPGALVALVAPGVPVSVFVATISFAIYVCCRLRGRRREAAA
nr:hypothetical protein [Mycobacterium alsense]